MREHSWQASGPGEIAAAAPAGDVGAALAQSHQVMISLLRQGTRLLAVVLSDGAARLVELGDFGTATEAALRLNVDLDTLAGRRRPPAMEAAIRASVRHHARPEPRDPRTGAALAGDDGIVIVPAGALASIPWNAARVRGRPVTVCPSASWWLESWRRSQRRGDASRPACPPLLLAGPYLQHARREITEIAALYPGSQPLLGATATVSAAAAAPSTARGSRTWPRTGTMTGRMSCSPVSTWPTAR